MSRLPYFLLLGISALSFVKAANNNVYFIRHGEKPPNDGQGLSPEGVQRASCIKDVFGPNSIYNIGYILAQAPKWEENTRIRALQTVTPLSYALATPVDIHCDRDDIDCVVDSIKQFSRVSNKDILVCWEHKKIQDIMTAIGVKNAPEYGKRFDLIYTVKNEKLDPDIPISERCAGLDN